MAACVCFCARELVSALPKQVIWRSPLPAEGRWDLCAITGPEAMRLSGTPLSCETLLVPEALYSPVWQARQVVSYGLSGRSSLTLSSMERRDLLCVRRALTAISGRTVEEQELLLPSAWGVYSPADRLLLAGTWLLSAGALPETGN